MTAAPPLKIPCVMVVHRSAISREVLRASLEAIEHMRVVAVPTAELALVRVGRERPDAVVMPVYSSEPAMQKLRADLEKLGVRVVDSDGTELIAHVRRATGHARRGEASSLENDAGQGAGAPMKAASRGAAAAELILIGASTGGTEALRRILAEMPAQAPPIVAVQHMPAGYTRSFAQRLDGLSRVSVREAQDGDRLIPGLALIAPGGLHARIVREGGELLVRLEESPQVNGHRPSVDVLFGSAASVLPLHTAAALLTGMGADGARGLLALREAGAFTVAQDEATSVVFGMPREAIARGAACTVAPIGRVASALLGLGE